MEGILACRPVELDPADRMDARILEMTFVYEGSVEGSCGMCGCAVWIGPRQRAAAAEGRARATVCFRCAALGALAGVWKRGAVDLGNPQAPPRG